MFSRARFGAHMVPALPGDRGTAEKKRPVFTATQKTQFGYCELIKSRFVGLKNVRAHTELYAHYAGCIWRLTITDGHVLL